jgi:uncharacterized membrane protein
MILSAITSNWGISEVCWRDPRKIPRIAVEFVTGRRRTDEGGGWETMDWWRIDPGNSADVFDNDVEDLHRYFYFYAKASDGAEWSGDYGPVYVYHRAFDSCVKISQMKPMG